MLFGAMDELIIGDPADPANGCRPVIDAAARERIETHIKTWKGRVVHATAMPAGLERGTFVAPTVIRLDAAADLDVEIFGPVLHVVTWKGWRDERDVDAVMRSGYGLTLGVHTRIGAAADAVRARARVGNLYVNRTMIGAVVGVQPFGGKAFGDRYRKPAARTICRGSAGSGPGLWTRPRQGQRQPAEPGVVTGAADLIVIGLGAAGSATLYQAAKRGARVIGIHRYVPPHNQGSSHGETRITRQAIGEGLDYVPLALRAHELWREIEAETGENLMLSVGALLISKPDLGAVHHGKHDFLERTFEAAETFSIPHERLDAREIRSRYPHFHPRDPEIAYFEPGAGMLYPERCIAAQLGLARRHGARVLAPETVLAIEPILGGVRVVTDHGRHEAAQAVVSAGAWAPVLLGGVYGDRLSLHRQTMHWFTPGDPAAFAPERFPVFIWMHGTRTQRLVLRLSHPAGRRRRQGGVGAV